MRLIDADYLKEFAIWIRDEGFDLEVVPISDFDYAPTIDPVRHGHWTDEHECSVCHNKAPHDIYNIRPEYAYDWEEKLVETGGIEYDEEYLETEWCPYCGARMDEEVIE